jgi:NAD(P) transhydrogenase subunit alpha
MKLGSVIVDMAAESGGNVEGSVAGEVVQVNGVNIIGTGNWANGVAKHASQMYANNLFNLVSEFWDKQAQIFTLDVEDEIQTHCLISHQGEVVNKTLIDFYASIDTTSGAA